MKTNESNTNKKVGRIRQGKEHGKSRPTNQPYNWYSQIKRKILPSIKVEQDATKKNRDERLNVFP